MGEVTYVFVDTWATCTDSTCWFHGQFDAVEIYCDRKLNAHPDNLVGIVCCGHRECFLSGCSNNPLCVSKAIGELKRLKAKYTTNLLRGFKNYSRDGWNPQDMKRRMVVFTGGPLYFPKHHLPQAIQLLKDERVILDVVDFGGAADDEYMSKQNLKDLFNAMNDYNSNEDSRYLLIQDYGLSLSHHISTLPSLSKEEEEEARIKRIRHCSGSSSICSNHHYSCIGEVDENSPPPDWESYLACFAIGEVDENIPDWESYVAGGQLRI